MNQSKTQSPQVTFFPSEAERTETAWSDSAATMMPEKSDGHVWLLKRAYAVAMTAAKEPYFSATVASTEAQPAEL